MMSEQTKFNYQKQQYLIIFIFSLFFLIFLSLFLSKIISFDIITAIILILIIFDIYLLLITGFSYNNYHEISNNIIKISCLGSNNYFNLSDIDKITKFNINNKDKKFKSEFVIISKYSKDLCQIRFKRIQTIHIGLIFKIKRIGIVFETNNLNQFIQAEKITKSKK